MGYFGKEFALSNITFPIIPDYVKKVLLILSLFGATYRTMPRTIFPPYVSNLLWVFKKKRKEYNNNYSTPSSDPYSIKYVP